MDIDQIRALLKVVAESGVAEVEIEDEEFKLVVRKHPPTVAVSPAPVYPNYGMNVMPVAPDGMTPAAAPAGLPGPAVDAGPAADLTEVRAPIVGTFYVAASPESSPFVQVGDEVAPGDVLCIIEAMKLMNEIQAEVGGTVREVLVENAQPVQYDEALFLIKAS